MSPCTVREQKHPAQNFLGNLHLVPTWALGTAAAVTEGEERQEG